MSARRSSRTRRRRKRLSQASVRSTTQRWRPRRWLLSCLRRAKRGVWDATCTQDRLATGVIVAFVGVELLGPVPWSSARISNGRHGFDGLLQHLGVVHVSGREYGGQGQSATLYHNVALRAHAGATDRTRAGFLAPFGAGIEQESTQARLQSSLSASARRWSNIQCKTSQTPYACQSHNRRQQVMPELQPSSGGSNSYGVPVRSTKTMPVSTARSGMRGRSPRGRGGTGGSNGSISSTACHSSTAWPCAKLNRKPILLDALI